MRLINIVLPVVAVGALVGCSDRKGPPAPVVYGREGAAKSKVGQSFEVPMVEVESAPLPPAPKINNIKAEKLVDTPAAPFEVEAFPEPLAKQPAAAPKNEKPAVKDEAKQEKSATEPKKDRKNFDKLLDTLADEPEPAKDSAKKQEKTSVKPASSAPKEPKSETKPAQLKAQDKAPDIKSTPPGMEEEIEEDVPELQGAEAEGTEPKVPSALTKPAKEAPLEKNAEPKAEATAEPAPTDVPLPTSSEVANGQPSFIWPTTGVITAHFNHDKGRLKNDGINIKAVKGTPVVAAESGTVAYAANELQGFGNLVIIKHEGGWMTTYGHNEKLLVKAGQRVAKGQQIASVGSSGNTPEPRLHFEIRKDKKPVNPEEYLP